MSPLLLLCTYGAALFGISLLGGALPQRVTMTHTRTQLAMSLVSGLMLGVAFFHLLPHAVLSLAPEQGIGLAMGWAMLGLVVMLLLLRMWHFHQPDYPAGQGHHHDGHCDGHHHEHGQRTVSWQGVLTGLTFHSFIDGIALGAALLASPHGHQEGFLAFGVFLAILLHKPLDAMSITTLMKAAGTTERSRNYANLLFAIICPLGACLFFMAAQYFGAVSATVVAPALAFSAGAFICIALSDLLPEVQFHSHDRVKLTATFLLGIGLAYLMAHSGDSHSHLMVAPSVSGLT